MRINNFLTRGYFVCNKVERLKIVDPVQDPEKHNSEWTRSRMDTIPNVHHPEWT